MTIREVPWPGGAPCWVECQVADIGLAATFYADLLGWDIETADDGMSEMVARVGGAAVAGLSPKPAAAGPPQWATVFAVDDLDAAVARAADAGGTALVDPVGDAVAGRLAYLDDPTGALVGLWQAAGRIGFERAHEPGTVAWSELHTRDLDAAKTFYAQVLGFRYDDTVDEQLSYATARGADGEAIAGLFLDAMMPPEVPAHWLVWFLVDEVDAVAERATAMGAVAMMTPSAGPSGRMSVLAAPHGEVFGLTDRPASTR